MPPEDWAEKIAALEQKLAEMEREVAALRAQGRRGAVQQALMDERLITLEHNRIFRLWNRMYRTAANAYARFAFDRQYGGLSDLRTPGDYARWISHEQHELEDHAAEVATWQYQPKFSVLLKEEGASEAEVQASLQSISQQSYKHWEMTSPAAGEYVLELSAGDLLAPYALHCFARALQEGPAAMVYGDEDRIGEDRLRMEPLFKPGWSPELLRNTNYLGRAVIRRVADGPMVVRHVPRVLYHGRAPHDLTVRNATARPGVGLSVIICSRDATRVRECLAAIRRTQTTECELIVVHHLEAEDGEEMRACAAKLGAKWFPYRGAFHFSRMTNLGAQKASAGTLLFLNDDVLVKTKGWDEAITGALAQQDVGIVGAILEYPNGAIQHAGIVVGMGDAVGHGGRFQMASELWPWLRMTREVSGVTGAMLAIRADLFREVGGFDEGFPSNYNDVDLCFRVLDRGLRILCLNVGRVVHAESQTRVGGTRHGERERLYARWAKRLARPDEFYSIHLAPMERIALGNGLRSGMVGLGPGEL